MNFKHCLLAFVMLIAPPAWADWEFVSKGESGNEFFIDYQTIRKDGNRIKVWQLTNFATPLRPKGLEIYSFLSRYEIDCKQEQTRVLTIRAYPRPNANGTLVLAEDVVGNWYDIAPKTVEWEINHSVCKAPAR